ncbi:MAG TPA: hypothetical protein DCM14_02640 [Clostridiales bacterium UBA8153]|nr:hypothetical protein [Clostridiales bacterium UBA8153]
MARCSNLIEESLAKADKVTLVGPGTLDIRAPPARQGRNPRTTKRMDNPGDEGGVFPAGPLAMGAGEKG